MRLFREVLIETAEQAEALPAGTLAWHSEGTGVDHAHKVAPLPGHHEGGWITLTGYAVNFQIIGWSALVPFEVEGKYLSRQRLCDADTETVTMYTTRQVPPP